MFKVRFRAPKYTVDKEGLSRWIREKVNVQIRQAAREFVKEAIVKIPVDTGQARGTFLPLGRMLGVSVDILGAKSKPGKNEDTGSSANNKLIFRFRDTKTQQGFEIDPQLFYFWFNDFFSHHYENAQLPTPWESLQTGWDAFITYMKEVAPERLPKLRQFIKVEMVDYGYKGI